LSTLATRIAALMSDYRWNEAVAVGAPVTVTYSFMQALPPRESPLTHPGFRAFTASERASARQALAAWSAVSGIRFVEVSDQDAGGRIRLGFHDFTGTTYSEYAGYSNYPMPSYDNYNTDLFLNTAQVKDISLGSQGFQVLLHEMGHAIGLKHPFDGANTLPAAEDNTNNTLMSYNWISGNAQSPRQYDIEAIRYLYGRSGASGTKYVWSGSVKALRITGSAASDFLLGGLHRNIVSAGGGNDTIIGGDQGDSIAGEAGHDSISSGAGNDSIDGGSGNDSILSGDGNDLIKGGLGNDYILSLNGNKSIDGGSGDDSISSGAGNDSIDGGSENDSISSGAGNDSIDGGSGNDSILSGDGNDLIKGGLGNDYILSLNGNKSIDGGSGDDSISSGDGNDSIDGGAGDDSISSGVGNDLIKGGLGNDYILSFYGNKMIDGGAGDDSISSGAGNDSIDGGAGNDSISSGDGSNSIDGGSGNDSILAGFGSDFIIGGAGNDIIAVGRDGYSLNDGETFYSAYGGAQLAILSGGDGHDTLYGGGGNDFIDGGAGRDLLQGGFGLGTPHFQLYGDGDLVKAGYAETIGRCGVADYGACDAGIVATLIDDSTMAVSLSGSRVKDRLSEITELDGTDFADRIVLEDAGNWVRDWDIYAQGGNDTITVDLCGTISINGGAGSDVLVLPINSSQARISTVGREVSVENTDNGALYVLSGVESLRFRDNSTRTLTSSSLGMTRLLGTLGANTLVGGGGMDSIIGNKGDDRLFGAAGADSLLGGSGVDQLYGGTGADVLYGGSAADELTGGAGRDLFCYTKASEGGDRITDFSRGEDHLRFVSREFGNITGRQLSQRSLLVNATGTASGTKAQFIFNTSNGVLTYDSNGTRSGGGVTVATLNVRSLSASDFVMVPS